MLFSKGINFQDYLNDYLFWQNEHFKSKKVFKNVLAVLYGKKKDRGHIKKRYIKRIEEQKRLMNIITRGILEKAPQLAAFIGGKYNVTIELISNNYIWNDGTSSPITYEFAIDKAIINIPSSSSKVYTGSLLKADETNFNRDLYNIVNNGGVDVGDYVVIFELKDSSNYKWDNSNSSVVEVSFKIIQAENEITDFELLNVYIDTYYYVYISANDKIYEYDQIMRWQSEFFEVRKSVVESWFQ